MAIWVVSLSTQDVITLRLSPMIVLFLVFVVCYGKITLKDL